MDLLVGGKVYLLTILQIHDGHSQNTVNRSFQRTENENNNRLTVRF